MEPESQQHQIVQSLLSSTSSSSHVAALQQSTTSTPSHQDENTHPFAFTPASAHQYVSTPPRHHHATDIQNNHHQHPLALTHIHPLVFPPHQFSASPTSSSFPHTYDVNEEYHQHMQDVLHPEQKQEDQLHHNQQQMWRQYQQYQNQYQHPLFHSQSSPPSKIDRASNNTNHNISTIQYEMPELNEVHNPDFEKMGFHHDAPSQLGEYHGCEPNHEVVEKEGLDEEEDEEEDEVEEQQEEDSDSEHCRATIGVEPSPRTTPIVPSASPSSAGSSSSSSSPFFESRSMVSNSVGSSNTGGNSTGRQQVMYEWSDPHTMPPSALISRRPEPSPTSGRRFSFATAASSSASFSSPNDAPLPPMNKRGTKRRVSEVDSVIIASVMSSSQKNSPVNKTPPAVSTSTTSAAPAIATVLPAKPVRKSSSTSSLSTMHEEMCEPSTRVELVASSLVMTSNTTTATAAAAAAGTKNESARSRKTSSTSIKSNSKTTKSTKKKSPSTRPTLAEDVFRCPCCPRTFSFSSRRSIKHHVMSCAGKYNLDWEGLEYEELVPHLEALVGRPALRGFVFRAHVMKRAAEDIPFQDRWYCLNENRGCPVYYAKTSTNSKERHEKRCIHRKEVWDKKTCSEEKKEDSISVSKKSKKKASSFSISNYSSSCSSSIDGILFTPSQMIRRKARQLAEWEVHWSQKTPEEQDEQEERGRRQKERSKGRPRKKKVVTVTSKKDNKTSASTDQEFDDEEATAPVTASRCGSKKKSSTTTPPPKSSKMKMKYVEDDEEDHDLDEEEDEDEEEEEEDDDEEDEDYDYEEEDNDDDVPLTLLISRPATKRQITPSLVAKAAAAATAACASNSCHDRSSSDSSVSVATQLVPSASPSALTAAAAAAATSTSSSSSTSSSPAAKKPKRSISTGKKSSSSTKSTKAAVVAKKTVVPKKKTPIKKQVKPTARLLGPARPAIPLTINPIKSVVVSKPMVLVDQAAAVTCRATALTDQGCTEVTVEGEKKTQAGTYLWVFIPSPESPEKSN